MRYFLFANNIIKYCVKFFILNEGCNIRQNHLPTTKYKYSNNIKESIRPYIINEIFHILQ